MQWPWFWNDVNSVLLKAKVLIELPVGPGTRAGWFWKTVVSGEFHVLLDGALPGTMSEWRVADVLGHSSLHVRVHFATVVVLPSVAHASLAPLPMLTKTEDFPLLRKLIYKHQALVAQRPQRCG